MRPATSFQCSHVALSLKSLGTPVLKHRLDKKIISISLIKKKKKKSGIKNHTNHQKFAEQCLEKVEIFL